MMPADLQYKLDAVCDEATFIVFVEALASSMVRTFPAFAISGDPLRVNERLSFLADAGQMMFEQK